MTSQGGSHVLLFLSPSRELFIHAFFTFLYFPMRDKTGIYRPVRKERSRSKSFSSYYGKEKMNLLDAIEEFDLALAAETSPANRKKHYFYNDNTGQRSGCLWHLARFIGSEQSLNHLTTAQLRRWRERLSQRDYSPYTLNKYLKSAKQFCRWLHIEGYLDSDPSFRLRLVPHPVKPPKEVRQDDAEAILRIANHIAIRDTAFCALVTQTDVSYKEAREALLSGFDIAQSQIFVHRYHRSRRDGERITSYQRVGIPLPPRVLHALSIYLSIRHHLATPSDEHLLFVAQRDQLSEMYRARLIVGLRDLALLETLASTAARLSGLINLKWADVDLQAQTCLLMEKGCGGGNAGRIGFLDDVAVKALHQWRNEQAHQSEYVFTNYNGKQLYLRKLGRLLTAMANLAGINGQYNPHAWRHAWAMNALRRGADIHTISNILGHSSIKVTSEYYLRWHQDELQKQHRQYSWRAKV